MSFLFKKNTMIVGLIGLLLLLLGFLMYYFTDTQYGRHSPIKVGLLFATTGTMALSETPVKNATLMAIEEINQKGGILGRKLKPIIVDSQSNLTQAAALANTLIKKDKVSVIFGCWTSSCRKTLKTIVETNNHLLIYPVQYEGLEQSPNIVYTGAAPNQQIIPAIKWAFDHIGKRFFLVGSDYIFPRIANAIIQDQVNILGGQIAGEEYLLLGSKDVDPIVKKIIQTKPSIIINTINGDSNIAFFKALRQAGITAKTIPTLSFSIAEQELQSMAIPQMVGNYAAWNYFQSIQTPVNQAFVTQFKHKFGNAQVTSDPMEAAYFGVYLWAQAVEEAGTADVNAVRDKIQKQSMNAPEGTVYIDQENQHTWKKVRIGKIKANGQFDIIWSAEKASQPIPYPTYRTKEAWDKLAQDLYKGWGNHWENTSSKNNN